MKDMPYYDHIKGKLENPSMFNKAMKFIKHGCISYDGDNTWLCGNIEGYNKRTYIIENKKVGLGEYLFTCNCQGYKKRVKEEKEPICSHVIGVKLFAGAESSRRKAEREKDGGTLLSY
jgi:hypothetical protein